MLRSLKELERTTVNASDGDVGSIANFLFDDDRWAVRYVVVETGTSFEQKSVLVSPISFRNIDWATRIIQLWLTRRELGNAPSGSNLRSANEVSGYQIQGSDDAIGHVVDFLVDDATWAIRYLVVDTGPWWADHKVLVAPEWATRVSLDERKVFVDMTRDAIKGSPAWIEHGNVDRDYEARLHDHHGRAGYWGDLSARTVHETGGAATGALAGAVLGAVAGPPGIVAGAIIGAAAGTVAGAVLDSEATSQAARTRELDAVIGVTAGTIGAPNLAHPRSTVGAFSAASAGAGAESESGPAEGPIQSP
jgi:hypothetical protein